MADPVLELYDSVGTLVDSGNKVEFGDAIEKGTETDIIKVYVWNDKGGGAGSDTATAPRVYVSSTPGIANFLAGTAANGNVSMIQGRSCAGINVAGDGHTEWTTLSPSSLLTLGDIPSNAAKEIELRIVVPQDSPDILASDFNIELSY